MAGFPLLTPGELEDARARWREQHRTPGTAAAALYENAELAVGHPRFQAPLELGLASNLFQVQSILLEASLAFACSGEERYLQPVTRCLHATADERVRRARLPNEVHRAFVVVGLAVAHELCGEAIERELLVDTVATLTAELHHAAAHEEWGDRVLKRNAWNHTAVAFAAIGCGGLLCAERDPRAQEWLADGLERVRLFFADGITDAGMTREGLTYCGFAFRNLAPLLLAARNAGVWDYRSPAQNSHLERLRAIPRWYAIETLPGGHWLQPINDSYWSPKRAMGGFLPTFGALDPPLTGWVYDMLLGARGDGSHGQDRGMATSSLFESLLWASTAEAGERDGVDVELPEVLADPVVGYVAERAGWRGAGGRRGASGERGPSCGDDSGGESGFSLNCGEYIGGIHDQSDNGSITLTVAGVPLLIDSGAANDPVEGSPSSSHGHNVVLIDDRGQLPSGGGAGCTGTIVRAERHSVASVFTVDMLAAYGARRYNPVSHAVRHCVYGKQPFPYLLVVDDFARPDGEQAAFDQLFHTPTVKTTTRTDNAVVVQIECEGNVCGLELRPLDEGAVFLAEEIFVQHDKALFDPHLLWRIRRERQGRVVMPTLVLPLSGGPAAEAPPQVMGTVDAAAGRVRLRWQTGGEEGEDVLSFTPGAATPAAFTRNGQPPAGAELLIAAEPATHAGGRVSSGVVAAVSRLRSVVGGTSDAIEERALRRRRRLRRLVDGIEAFEGAGDSDSGNAPDRRLGRELLEQLVSFADLDPDDSVLELECGSGHVALALLHYLRYGSYTGLDASADAVQWCHRELTPRNPRFHFARRDPAQALLPCKDESLDFVVITSLQAQRDLPELARVLREGGSVFLTTTLDDDELSECLAGVVQLSVDRSARGALAGLHAQPDIVVLRRGR